MSFEQPGDKSIIPTHIQSDDDYSVKTIVLKQVDRITYMLSIGQSNTTGTSENYRSLGFGIKSGLMSLESLISPYIKESPEYYIQSKQIKRTLTLLEKQYALNSRDFRYWELLNDWLSLLCEELAHMGYFPAQIIDELEYD